MIYALRVVRNTNRLIGRDWRRGAFVRVYWCEVDMGPPGSHWSMEPTTDIEKVTFFGSQRRAENAARKLAPVGVTLELVPFSELSPVARNPIECD